MVHSRNKVTQEGAVNLPEPPPSMRTEPTRPTGTTFRSNENGVFVEQVGVTFVCRKIIEEYRNDAYAEDLREHGGFGGSGPGRDRDEPYRAHCFEQVWNPLYPRPLW